MRVEGVLRLLTAMGASLLGALVSVVSVLAHRHGALLLRFNAGSSASFPIIQVLVRSGTRQVSLAPDADILPSIHETTRLGDLSGVQPAQQRILADSNQLRHFGCRIGSHMCIVYTMFDVSYYDSEL